MSPRRARRTGPLVAAALLVALLAACGQKGPLYLPEEGRTVVTRPAPEAAATPADTAPAGGPPEDSKQTVPRVNRSGGARDR